MKDVDLLGSHIKGVNIAYDIGAVHIVENSLCCGIYCHFSTPGYTELDHGMINIRVKYVGIVQSQDKVKK